MLFLLIHLKFRATFMKDYLSVRRFKKKESLYVTYFNSRLLNSYMRNVSREHDTLWYLYLIFRVFLVILMCVKLFSLKCKLIGILIEASENNRSQI